MTEFEQQELSNALADQIIALAQLQASHIAIYLTVVFAYIVAAFAAGKRLTKFQVSVATVLFVVAGLSEIYQIVSTGAGINLLMQTNAPSYGAASSFGLEPSFRMVVTTVVWSTGLVGAIAFMWSVRHSDIE